MVKPTASAGRLATPLHHARVHRALANRITALADAGLSGHEIAANLGTPLALVFRVLRGATLGELRR